MIDVIIVALIAVFLSVFLAKWTINDYKRERLDEKRFVLKHLGNPMSHSEYNPYKNRDKGALLAIIAMHILYVYLRLSGKLGNIFPFILDYYGFR